MGLATVVAGRFGVIAFGKQSNAKLGTGIGFPVPKSATQDPLYNITRSMFTSAVNTKFSALLNGVYVADLVLIGVNDLSTQTAKGNANSSRDAFSLVFQAPLRSTLKQDTYLLWNAKLGTFKLFLVPGNASGRLGPHLEAVINRIFP